MLIITTIVAIVASLIAYAACVAAGNADRRMYVASDEYESVWASGDD